ncbi:peptidyl-tRNA hydrolase II [Violaceomyces palustris]|uniref:Peptidyl-tRNA hydrolase II n=1 Tax=Violaceomyces palustris TaxID=1673888 RepID=A0ACD0P5K9_9BASI|nr:peptidyl-tRNA hydrolase II [Violaceomyces palustris]
MAASVSSHLAVAILSATVGYWLGMGKSLLSYGPVSRKEESSDEEEGSEDEGDLSDPKVDLGSRREECKMVLVVRTDLKMEKGKIAAQCGHATLATYKSALKKHPSLVKQWETFGQAKVALKCPNEELMLQIEDQARKRGLAARSIIDAGRTQIAPNTRTVLGIGPAPKSIIDEITGDLKLL